MLKIEIEQEEDGRWIGEISELPGVLVYAASADEARIKATALALRIIADEIEHPSNRSVVPALQPSGFALMRLWGRRCAVRGGGVVVLLGGMRWRGGRRCHGARR
jgi:predicted RNase H-like HicB family nuclease